jgi:hypothetical protein
VSTELPLVKRLAMFIAAAALAVTPAAAAAKKPERAKDRGAKVERKATKPASAQQRCRDERKALGPAAFAAKYGKARTKGSARAKAKAARAAFGRCIAQTTKRLRAERDSEEDDGDDEDDALEDEHDAEYEKELADEDAATGQDAYDDHPEENEKPEPDDGDQIADHEEGKEAKDPDAEDGPGIGLGGNPDLD